MFICRRYDDHSMELLAPRESCEIIDSERSFACLVWCRARRQSRRVPFLGSRPLVSGVHEKNGMASALFKVLEDAVQDRNLVIHKGATP